MYIDHLTKLTRLRAVHFKTKEEVCSIVEDLFYEYGPPHVLHMGDFVFLSNTIQNNYYQTTALNSGTEH